MFFFDTIFYLVDPPTTLGATLPEMVKLPMMWVRGWAKQLGLLAAYVHFIQSLGTSDLVHRSGGTVCVPYSCVVYLSGDQGDEGS